MNSIRWMSLVIVLVAIDQLSKWWTEMALPLHSQIRLLPFLSYEVHVDTRHDLLITRENKFAL